MTQLRKIQVIRHFPWIICFLLAAVVPDTSMADYVRIKGTVVNVRQGPGTSHPVLFQAEQGEEFDLISTEGLWCLVKLGENQEAWVFRKLVEVVPGSRPGMDETDKGPDKNNDTLTGWSITTQIGFMVFAFILATIGIWKRKAILHYMGVRLRDISGYKRDQAFRYDNRKPNDDSWEL